MYRGAFFLAGGLVLGACTGPSEPEMESPTSERTVAGSSRTPEIAIRVSSPALQTVRFDPASPGAAIEDALVRILPSIADQTVAAELRPLLQERLRQLEAGAEQPVRDQGLARLRDFDSDQADPDLAALWLALESTD